MSMPGFTAEASVYKSAVPYVTGRPGVPMRCENALTPQQLLTLGRYTVNPDIRSWKRPWICRLEYGICRFAIPLCIHRCISDALADCVFEPDPEACAAGVGILCSESCRSACESQYARCLSGGQG
jgi:hypothetical protein